MVISILQMGKMKQTVVRKRTQEFWLHILLLSPLYTLPLWQVKLFKAFLETNIIKKTHGLNYEWRGRAFLRVVENMEVMVDKEPGKKAQQTQPWMEKGKADGWSFQGNWVIVCVSSMTHSVAVSQLWGRKIFGSNPVLALGPILLKDGGDGPCDMS